jgi:hypothetical protein
MYHVQEDFHSTTVYGSASAAKSIPRYELAEEEMEPRLAKRFIADELQLVRAFSYSLPIKPGRASLRIAAKAHCY